MADGTAPLVLRDPGDLIESVAASATTFLDTEFAVVDDGTAFAMSYQLSGLSADREITALDVAGFDVLSDAVLTVESIPFVDASGRLSEDTTFVRDAGTGNIGIGTPSPVATAHIVGSADQVHLAVEGYSSQTADYFQVLDYLQRPIHYIAADGVVFNELGQDFDFRVESDIDTGCLFVNAGTNSVHMGGGGTITGQRLFVYRDKNANEVNKGLFSKVLCADPSAWTSEASAVEASLELDGSSCTYTGQQSALQFRAFLANPVQVRDLRAVSGVLQFTGTPVVTTASAFFSVWNNQATGGTTTNAIGFRNQFRMLGAGASITFADNFKVEVPTLTGTIGQFRGFTMPAGTYPGSTWGVYIEAHVDNYFEGAVGIGTLSPSAKLHVAGDADEVQFSVDANATQTANIVEIRDDVGADLVVVDGTGNLHIASSSNELRFYEGSNYVGFEAPSLAADQIWVLPDADGAVGEQLATDGAGNLSWTPGDHDNSWSYASPTGGGTKTTYAGGFYKHAASSDDFSGGPTFGNANGSTAAHFFVVLGAATVDELTIRVTGTRITDGGVRTASYAADIVIPNSTAVDSYFETPEKFLGQVTVTVLSGTAKVCDHGWSKYWDSNNRAYTVTGLECTWLGGGNDSGADITLRHHKTTGWTYTGSGATPPTAIASMVGDHVTETDIDLNENGAWKRSGLSVAVDGSASEGVMWEVLTTAANTFQSATFTITTRN